MSLVLVMESSMSATVFTIDKPTTKKITTFRGYLFLTTTCADLVERRWLRIGQLEFKFSAKNFICKLSWAISSRFRTIHF